MAVAIADPVDRLPVPLTASNRVNGIVTAADSPTSIGALSNAPGLLSSMATNAKNPALEISRAVLRLHAGTLIRTSRTCPLGIDRSEESRVSTTTELAPGDLGTPRVTRCPLGVRQSGTSARTQVP